MYKAEIKDGKAVISEYTIADQRADLMRDLEYYLRESDKCRSIWHYFRFKKLCKKMEEIISKLNNLT